MNKMFKKIVATTAAVSTVACLSVSAFAATADYDKDTQKVKLTDWAASGEGQYTIVVVPKTWDGSDETIYYINQDSDSGMATLVNGMGVKTDLYALADAEDDDTAEFQVWVGSDVAGYTIAKFDFTVSAKVEGPTGIEVTLSYGDVNADGTISAGDGVDVIKKSVGLISSFTATYENASIVVDEKLADVNADGTISAGDGVDVIKKSVGLIDVFTTSDGNTLPEKYTFTYTPEGN